jgi:hypothetical protein
VGPECCSFAGPFSVASEIRATKSTPFASPLTWLRFVTRYSTRYSCHALFCHALFCHALFKGDHRKRCGKQVASARETKAKERIKTQRPPNKTEHNI